MIEWSGMVPHECVSPRRSVSAVHLGPWIFPFTGDARVFRAAITLGRLPPRTAPSAGRSLHLAPCLYCSLGVLTPGSMLVVGLPLLMV
jgi:hypothetical protein